MRIRFFADYCSSDHIMEKYISIYGYDPGWFVADDSYTHAIIINTAMPNIAHIPKKNVVGLAYEPIPFLGLTPRFIDYATKYIGRYFIGDSDGLPPPFESHYSFFWHTWISRPIKPQPRRGVSLMVSHKQQLPGHKYRYFLASEILKHNLPVDIWGRGVPLLKQIFGDKPQLKSVFEESIGTLLNTYKYSIAIENMQTDSYVSEKFNDCIMTETIPIYLGARRIDAFYGAGACIHLTGRLEEDIEIIRKACADTSDELPAPLRFAREHLMTSPKVCLFKAIEAGEFFLP